MSPTDTETPLRVAPTRRWRELIAAAVLVVAIAWIGIAVGTQQRIDLAAIPRYLFHPVIMTGLLRTLEITALSMLIGLVLGFASAVARVSPNRVLRGIAWFYVWFFRGTPVLVQLIFWFNLGVLFQSVSLGIPYLPALVSAPTNDLITPFTAALLGLGLNEGAYMSEIVRAGVLSVDQGQTEAARALGMTRGRIMRVIVLPQAMRVIVPPTGNELIGLLKTSSLASVISFQELLSSATRIYSVNLEVLELLLVVSIWYLAITSVLSAGQWALERRLAAGSGIATAPSLLDTMRDGILGRRAALVRRGAAGGAR
jgi:polar amino acid transport system permease protein